MEAPALVFQNLLPETIAIAGGMGGVIASSVSLNGQDHAPRLVGVGASKVDAKPRYSVLWCYRDSFLCESVPYVQLERVEWDVAERRANFCA
jgi:hypothetical protein